MNKILRLIKENIDIFKEKKLHLIGPKKEIMEGFFFDDNDYVYHMAEILGIKDKRPFSHIEGYWGLLPIIKKLSFNGSSKMEVYLEDGRIVIIPLSYFPSIKKLSENQRKKYEIIDYETFTFKDHDQLYHLTQILGKEEYYSHSYIDKI